MVLGLPVFACASLVYWETKGPFKNWMQVVDWDRDDDLDVIVSHTRWEAVDISWAGIGRWINQGDGKFELARDRGTGAYPFFFPFSCGPSQFPNLTSCDGFGLLNSNVVKVAICTSRGIDQEIDHTKSIMCH